MLTSDKNYVAMPVLMNISWTNIITGDEIWIFSYVFETRMQSSQWKGKGPFWPKKNLHVLVNHESDSGGVFDWKVLVHYELTTSG